MAEVVPLQEINPDIQEEIAFFREHQETMTNGRNISGLLGFVAVAFAIEGFPEALQVANPLIRIAIIMEIGRRAFKYFEDFTIYKNPASTQEELS